MQVAGASGEPENTNVLTSLCQRDMCAVRMLRVSDWDRWDRQEVGAIASGEITPAAAWGENWRLGSVDEADGARADAATTSSTFLFSWFVGGCVKGVLRRGRGWWVVMGGRWLVSA
jgi:hypothetical protein